MWVTRLFKTSDDDIVCGPGILRLPFEEDGAIYVANWGAGAPSAPGSIFIQSCVSLQFLLRRTARPELPLTMAMPADASAPPKRPDPGA